MAYHFDHLPHLKSLNLQFRQEIKIFYSKRLVTTWIIALSWCLNYLTGYNAKLLYTVLHKYRHTIFLAGNYVNLKNWVPSMLYNNLWLISMGTKQQFFLKVWIERQKLGVLKLMQHSVHIACRCYCSCDVILSISR